MSITSFWRNMMARQNSFKSNLLTRILTGHVTCYLLFFSTVFLPIISEQDCGEYHWVSSSGIGTLKSPGYPNVYGENVKCIWMIATSSDRKVKISVSYTGERYNGTCSDYLEIREGSRSAEIKATLCDTHTDEEYISEYGRMWIMLKSDSLVGTGSAMNATFSSVYNSTTADIVGDWNGCQSYKFECPNRECVSMSYRCDGFNDCGCLKDCDEDECGSLSFTKGVQMIIGFSLGVGVFIAICVYAILHDEESKWMASRKAKKLLQNTKINNTWISRLKYRSRYNNDNTIEQHVAKPGNCVELVSYIVKEETQPQRAFVANGAF